MALQQSDFDFVQKLVQQKAAIVLDNGKQYFVESRLTPLAQNTGHDSIEKLIQFGFASVIASIISSVKTFSD